MRSARRIAVALALVAALATAGSARADGDPASDVLYTTSVFFSFTTALSTSAQKAVTETVARAKEAGYPIRVAIIEKQDDLGAVTSLWEKPRQYAKFLDIELSFIYKGPLLIVMPSGLGFAHYKKATASEYRTLAGITVDSGPNGLAASANRAVVALAALAGQRIAPVAVTGGGGGGSSSAGLVAGGVAALVVLGGAAFFVWWRRRPA
jgi:hypothetical protein